MMSAAGVLGDALRALTAQVAAFEALLLTASALHKTLRWSSLLEVVRGFVGVPAPLAPPVLLGAAAVEIAAALLLILPAARTAGAILAAVIWAVYLGLILRAIAQGRRDADCGCSFGTTLRPLGGYQVCRNGLLLGLAGCVAADSSSSGVPAVQGSQFLAALALLALYGALDQVMALQPLRRGAVL